MREMRRPHAAQPVIIDELPLASPVVDRRLHALRVPRNDKIRGLSTHVRSIGNAVVARYRLGPGWEIALAVTRARLVLVLRELRAPILPPTTG